MPFVQNKKTTRDKDACGKDYQQLHESASFAHISYCDHDDESAQKILTAEQYVRQLLQEAPEAKKAVRGKLAVVTGVHLNSIGYYVAQELAIQAGMHVMVLGKSESGLLKCCQAIHNEANNRRRNNLRHQEKIVLYPQKYRLDSLQVIETAAAKVIQQAESSSSSNYNGQIHVLVNAATVGSEQAKLTVDGIEYNTGCNLIGTHYFTKLLLPYLQKAVVAANNNTNNYKPRVACTASIGHAFGTNFNPQRLVDYPQEGGAPEGYIVVHDEFGLERTMTIQPNDVEDRTDGPPTSNIMSQAELADAVTKRGTQVGRSKMALVADIIHLARLHPEINFTTHHPGSFTTFTASANKSPVAKLLLPSRWWLFGSDNSSSPLLLTPSHGARAALRAALDPDMNTAQDLQGGAYLHVNGDPWMPMDPATHPAFAEACYDAAEAAIQNVTKASSYQPPEYQPMPVQSSLT